MRYANLKGVLLKMGFVLLCAAMVMPTATGRAQESEFKLPDFYPESFSGYGCIDSIDSDGVVIDDRSMRFSATATFHTPTKPNAGYIRNADKEIESLWFIRPCRQ